MLRDLNITHVKPTVEIAIGSLIKDRFIIEEKIASGGMGTVYKARDKRREEAHLDYPYIAIKVLNSDLRHHAGAFAALQHEAAKAQTLNHPNIVRIFDFDRDGDLAFITMEYLQGVTLKEFIRNPTTYQLTPEQKNTIIIQLLSALTYAHEQNCVHADLKPSNVFILNNLTVKIIDFGIANAVHEIPNDKQTSHFSPEVLHAYSAAYATAEIVNGKKPDFKDDIYAIACIIYELLGTEHPYQRKSAVVALEDQLPLHTIAGLNKPQWSALENALSLEKKSCTYTMADLSHVFRTQPSRKPYGRWIIAGVIFVIIILLANHIGPLF
jgi:serine/threonine protein kinase